jgi:poly-gamma-glutamate capsule biosynthesis protein CapA/YwtB (metallophosphatase superfamily)
MTHPGIIEFRRATSGRPARALAVMAALLVAAACGGSGPAASSTPRPSIEMTPTPWATASPSPIATPSPTSTPIAPQTFPLAVIARYDDTRTGLTSQALSMALYQGSVMVPCEVSELGLDGSHVVISPDTPCLAGAAIVATIHATKDQLALVPPSLVTPSVKVLTLDGADLFGAPSKRALEYHLYGEGTVPDGWTAYNRDDVRTLISTGDTCPDRGVSYMADTFHKGWTWVLDGGTAHYRSFKTSSWDWPVPIISRNGDLGTVSRLISDNDVSANDFECPVVSNWVQHNTGMVFSIDPQAVTMLAAEGGVKVVTLGSNHITDAGKSGVTETIQYLDKAGIKHTGAGNDLESALAPAVVDVRGVKFAFVGWDDIGGSRAASTGHPGVAPMTDANVCSSIKAARALADVVIAMPQWGWPEYHANVTSEQVKQRQLFYDCGADGVLGSGTHWASWASILPGPNGSRFAIGSHGNFLFDQSWSRQTMEGVIVEVTFVGTKLAQFRLHPYVVVQGAQPNLLDPTTDGAYVLNQVWQVSDVR